MSEENTLRRALEEVGLPPSVVAGCCTHYGLLARWNRTHNLTRIVDPKAAAIHHYLDCALPLLRWPAPAAFLDVGSGAGFPGLVAALVWPQATATLLEPARKRASFLRVAAGELGRGDVRVVSPGPSLSAPLVLSRATFSHGARATLWPYVAAGGALLAWTTLHERATWTNEVATWPDASLTWQEYELPQVGQRLIAVVSKDSGGMAG